MSSRRRRAHIAGYPDGADPAEPAASASAGAPADGTAETAAGTANATRTAGATGTGEARGRRRAGGARWHVPRSRGATAGTLLVVLGLWGSLIPFVGQYFGYGFGANETWTWHAARFWLQVLPGIAAVVGGLLLALSTTRVVALAGGWLACAAGAWFIIGPQIAALWNPGSLGTPMGGPKLAAAEWIGSFYGLGTVILFLGATALGRLSVVGVRDARAAAARRDDTRPVDGRAAGARSSDGRPADVGVGDARTGGTRQAGPLGGWRTGGIHRRGRRTPERPTARAGEASGPDAPSWPDEPGPPGR